MMDSNMERHIGETMAEVLRERLIELEILAATRDAPGTRSAGLRLCARCWFDLTRGI